jgi:hypothetical protein
MVCIDQLVTPTLLAPAIMRFFALLLKKTHKKLLANINILNLTIYSSRSLFPMRFYALLLFFKPRTRPI